MEKARGPGVKQDQGGIGVYTDDISCFKVFLPPFNSSVLWLSSME